uniref:Uncharacterized protein n=1 Tax=Oryza glumipatula TaxID=40148 RepID=A0A0D9YQ04_9ORYZ
MGRTLLCCGPTSPASSQPNPASQRPIPSRRASPQRRRLLPYTRPRRRRSGDLVSSQHRIHLSYISAVHLGPHPPPPFAGEHPATSTATGVSHTQLRTTANRRYVTCRSPSPVRTILTAVVVVVALLLLRLHTTSATSEPPTTNVSWSVILFGARSGGVVCWFCI